MPPAVVREQGLIERLEALGYSKVAGNRFARPLDDVPARVGNDDSSHRAVIDVLVPAYTSRPRRDRRVGDTLITTEVPGLSFALTRPAVNLEVIMRRLNGQTLEAELAIADEVSALSLKAMATTVRSKDTDVVDIWRCLEVAYAAGIGAGDFRQDRAAEGAAVVRRLFEDRDGSGMAAIVREQRLSGASADMRFTRIRALIERVLGPDAA